MYRENALIGTLASVQFTNMKFDYTGKKYSHYKKYFLSCYTQLPNTHIRMEYF